MTTVTVGQMGTIGLPDGILQASHIQPGTELVAIAEAGKIILIDRKQVPLCDADVRPEQAPSKQTLQERMKAVDAEMRARFRKALEENGEASVFAGLSLEEYLALSEAEERALWERLYQEAEREVKIDEYEIPSHFRSVGQRDGA
jgi:bifunctional DNA-binding transcriptional regulator/antitoxin component of YhaV-PrlF toxin-antitoxin module